jgi:multidrug resistance efflux pump
MTPAAPQPDLPAGAAPALAQRCLALYALVLAAPDAASAARRLAAALASEFAYSRVSIGLRQGPRTVLVAVTGLERIEAAAELPMLLAGAMDEAIEQGLTLCEPPADGGVALTLELRTLRQQVGGALACVPLAQEQRALGAVCVERHDGRTIAPDEARQLEHLLALAAPALHWMQRDALPLRRRLWQQARDGWAALRRPSRRHTRRLVIGATLALAALALAPLEHEVGGRARLEGEQQRVLAAPTDGFVKAVHARPGDRVASGALLVELLEQDLQLERERWASQAAQHENAYAAAMARADRAQAAVAVARLEEAQAQVALVDEQLGRARVSAPFDGVVIQGDLNQSIGAPVRQGDTLLTLATTAQHRVVVEVDEVEIALVQPGQTGSLRLSALAWRGHPIVVERITPLAKVVDGRNVFEVQARLLEADPSLRPGLLGRAKLVVGRLPPLWAWLRPLADRARLAWWAGVGT